MDPTARRLPQSIGALAAVSLSLTLTGCGESATLMPTATGPAPASPARAASPSPTRPATPAPTGTPTPAGPSLEPAGYPLDPAFRTSRVVGEVGARRLVPGAGPAVREYSRRDQPSADPVRANASGWNCRTHLEYEGQPAVDWYVPAGTPVHATMDGTATLYVNTVVNSFDFYGVPREPYLGSPDRARAPLVPFPGPGGGMGVYVAVTNEAFVSAYGHLDLAATLGAVPPGAFLSPFSAEFDYASAFAAPRDFRVAAAIASWPVRRGQLIGYTGDAGYSDAPHLHYQIRRAGSSAKLCPTTEAGFPDGGWLEVEP